VNSSCQSNLTLFIAGPEEYKALRDAYMRSTDSFVMVCSCDYKKSVEELNEFYEQILRVKDRDKVPMVIALNKTDLKTNLKGEPCLTVADVHDILPWSKEHKIPIFTTSAKQRVNVDEVYHEAIRIYRNECMQNYLSKQKVNNTSQTVSYNKKFFWHSKLFAAQKKQNGISKRRDCKIQ